MLTPIILGARVVRGDGREGTVEPAWFGSLRPMSPFDRASTRKRFPEKRDEAWDGPFRTALQGRALA